MDNTIKGIERGSLPVLVGLACHNCYKETDVQLSRCGGCRRVSYCGTECRNAKWEAHKPMCKALKSLEKKSIAAEMLVSSLPEQPITNLAEIRELIDGQLSICLSLLQRPVTIVEHTWFTHEPRCIVCTRTDMVIRMEAAMNGTTADRRLTPCPQCMLSFCCSPAHWEAARELHQGPSEDLRDGLSQCEKNRLIRGQIAFDTTRASLLDRYRQLIWISRRVKSGWVSLDGLSWQDEFDGEIRKSFGIPATSPSTFLLAAASDTLSMPMTILYGLSKFNNDDGWTRKHALTVHILGANFKEVSCSRVFEEILHRTPQVKTLKLVMCGPEVEVPTPKSGDQAVCSNCAVLGRSYVLDYVVDTYHDFVKQQAEKFEDPDLCVAFNAGASTQVTGYTWATTIKLLLKRKLPTLLTAYNREEAKGDASVLRAAGAVLHPALGPATNPWGSMKGAPTTHSTYGFHVENGWLAGGFK
ncbi:hypothetical protein C8F04DRAFT_1039603 [Mycena alexandri]|uniref:MYND-type domain-containing protein n=1 Tax=Mycena alexandri TaxID=1745969 RepID=A0AAD6X391_9AGAR|nr:hypothetical protein C8F04DRAFT_1039603 [Mycena alexandri]